MVKDSACSAGDLGSIPGSGTSPGERNGNSYQYYCLGNPMNRGAWWATVHGVAKESDTTERLNYQQPTKASPEQPLPAPPEMYKEQRPPCPRLHQKECALRNTKVSDFASNSNLLFLHGGRDGRRGGGEINMGLEGGEASHGEVFTRADK